VNSDLRKGYAEAAALLDPILAGRVDGLWNPREARWRLFHFSTIDESTVPNFVLCLPEFVPYPDVNPSYSIVLSRALL